MNIDELSHFIESWGKDVYTFCTRLTGNKDEADELYQKTFLKATELKDRIDLTGNPKSYLISISIKLWQNEKRKFLRRKNIAPLEVYLDEVNIKKELSRKYNPEDIVITNELRKRVLDGIQLLNDKFKVPIALFYTSGFSIKEIAKTLGISEGTVKNRLYKGRKLMKKYLEVNGYDKY